MLKKLKNFLGIEGVKIDLTLPVDATFDEGQIEGHVILSSGSEQKIQHIEISLYERYQRGRKDNSLINEYLIGKIELTDQFVIQKDETKRIPFVLEFVKMMSEMDKLENDHFVFKGIVKFAKFMKGVKSSYRVEAKAIQGDFALSPTVSKPIKIK